MLGIRVVPRLHRLQVHNFHIKCSPLQNDNIKNSTSGWLRQSTQKTRHCSAVDHNGKTM